VPWPPTVGELLPRGSEVWYEQRKLEWILGDEGHGREWARVFLIEPTDQERVWAMIASAMPEARIDEVRESPYGITCGVEIKLTIDDRRAKTLVSWHYATETAAPRLVTAYPTP
jgi:hypothetical protein